MITYTIAVSISSDKKHNWFCVYKTHLITLVLENKLESDFFKVLKVSLSPGMFAQTKPIINNNKLPTKDVSRKRYCFSIKFSTDMLKKG